MNESTFFVAGGRTVGRVVWPFLKDRLLLALVAVGVMLSMQRAPDAAIYWHWIDWSTILTLAGLMVLTKGIELSGYLDHLGHRIIGRLRTQRTLALFLVGAAALLSTLLTNDIALFIVVPLTLGMRRVPGLPIGRLVIFQALAVNAGSLLTPIGNPQNILLWQQSGLSFMAFVVQMLPLAAALLGALLAVTALAFSGTAIGIPPEVDRSLGNTRVLGVCSVLYVAFLAAVELGHPGWALPVVLLCVSLLSREILLDTDWSLLAVFLLMFVDVRLVTEGGFINHGLAGMPGYSQWRLFLAGLTASQLISNVPATILLLKYAPASKTVAYAVNAGGFGFVFGSMANLIALRMVGERGIWLRFHMYSIPFLLLAAVIGYALL